ncbi:hypothetical protein DOTSEDRAFT_71421, partial [Dothistroma septosporum NZE10]
MTEYAKITLSFAPDLIGQMILFANALHDNRPSTGESCPLNRISQGNEIFASDPSVRTAIDREQNSLNGIDGLTVIMLPSVSAMDTGDKLLLDRVLVEVDNAAQEVRTVATVFNGVAFLGRRDLADWECRRYCESPDLHQVSPCLATEVSHHPTWHAEAAVSELLSRTMILESDRDVLLLI